MLSTISVTVSDLYRVLCVISDEVYVELGILVWQDFLFGCGQVFQSTPVGGFINHKY